MTNGEGMTERRRTICMRRVDRLLRRRCLNSTPEAQT